MVRKINNAELKDSVASSNSPIKLQLVRSINPNYSANRKLLEQTNNATKDIFQKYLYAVTMVHFFSKIVRWITSIPSNLNLTIERRFAKSENEARRYNSIDFSSGKNKCLQRFAYKNPSFQEKENIAKNIKTKAEMLEKMIAGLKFKKIECLQSLNTIYSEMENGMAEISGILDCGPEDLIEMIGKTKKQFKQLDLSLRTIMDDPKISAAILRLKKALEFSGALEEKYNQIFSKNQFAHDVQETDLVIDPDIKYGFRPPTFDNGDRPNSCFRHAALQLLNAHPRLFELIDAKDKDRKKLENECPEINKFDLNGFPIVPPKIDLLNSLVNFKSACQMGDNNKIRAASKEIHHAIEKMNPDLNNYNQNDTQEFLIPILELLGVTFEFTERKESLDGVFFNEKEESQEFLRLYLPYSKNHETKSMTLEEVIRFNSIPKINHSEDGIRLYDKDKKEVTVADYTERSIIKKPPQHLFVQFVRYFSTLPENVQSERKEIECTRQQMIDQYILDKSVSRDTSNDRFALRKEAVHALESSEVWPKPKYVDPIKIKINTSLTIPENLTVDLSNLFQDPKNDLHYKLIGFIKHSGERFDNGHYTASVNTKGQWYHTNDANRIVDRRNEQEIQKEFSDTYVCLLEKIEDENN